MAHQGGKASEDWADLLNGMTILEGTNVPVSRLNHSGKRSTGNKWNGLERCGECVYARRKHCR